MRRGSCSSTLLTKAASSGGLSAEQPQESGSEKVMGMPLASGTESNNLGNFLSKSIGSIISQTTIAKTSDLNGNKSAGSQGPQTPQSEPTFSNSFAKAVPL